VSCREFQDAIKQLPRSTERAAAGRQKEWRPRVRGVRQVGRQPMARYGDEVGFLDRMKQRPLHDGTSIRKMLEAKGAAAGDAQEIVEILSHRISHDDMHVWLSHPKKSHGIPDPELEEKFGVVMYWTPINAVSAGKTALVIDEARRFVEG
jgi:hypothetical protein